MNQDEGRPRVPAGQPVMGAHAMGLGAVLGGCRYFSAYPITPQTELLEYMSEALPERGGIFQQLSDELSAIMACFGAAAAGTRVMTASVGPGLTLMVDGLTNSAGAELPMVIGAITRAHVGVSAGLLPAQSDMRMLKGGGNGDYHLPIYAPCSITETAKLTAEAFDVADLYRTPVFVAIDGWMSNMIETLQPFEIQKRRLPAKDWTVAVPFAQGKRVISAQLTPEIDTYRCYKLHEKYRQMKRREARYESYCLDDAEYALVAYGIMARVAKETVRRARERGIKAGLFRPVTIYPFPEQALGDLSGHVREILVTEINFGQVLPDVRLAVRERCPIQFLGQPAMPISPARLLTALTEMSEGRTIAPCGIEDVHPDMRACYDAIQQHRMGIYV